MQWLWLPDRAVLGFHNLAQSREREMFRIEALTAGGGIVDETDARCAPLLLIAIEGDLPGGLAHGDQKAVHRVAEDQHAIGACPNEIAGVAGRMSLKVNGLDDAGE